MKVWDFHGVPHPWPQKVSFVLNQGQESGGAQSLAACRGVRGTADPIPAQLDSGITVSFQRGKQLLHKLFFF